MNTYVMCIGSVKGGQTEFDILAHDEDDAMFVAKLVIERNPENKAGEYDMKTLRLLGKRMDI